MVPSMMVGSMELPWTVQTVSPMLRTVKTRLATNRARVVRITVSTVRILLPFFTFVFSFHLYKYDPQVRAWRRLLLDQVDEFRLFPGRQ